MTNWVTKRLTEATRVLVSLELEMGWEEGGGRREGVRVVGVFGGYENNQKEKKIEMESGKLMWSGGRGSKTENWKKKSWVFKGLSSWSDEQWTGRNEGGEREGEREWVGLHLPHLSKSPGLSGKDSTQRRSLHFIDILSYLLFTPRSLPFYSITLDLYSIVNLLDFLGRPYFNSDKKTRKGLLNIKFVISIIWRNEELWTNLGQMFPSTLHNHFY